MKVIMYRYVPIAVRRVRMSIIYATNVTLLSIATPLARRNTDQSIRKSVRNMSDLQLSMLLNYTMKNYSNNHHHNLEIVQYASSNYQHLLRGEDIIHVAERRYAADVLMRLFMITKAIKLSRKLVHFVELHVLLQKRN